MKYTIDYTQDAEGKWSGWIRETGEATYDRNTIEDCVGDVYDLVGDDAELEVGDVREHPAHGLFGQDAFAPHVMAGFGDAGGPQCQGCGAVMPSLDEPCPRPHQVRGVTP